MAGTALVTGASRGIGRAVAEGLARQGYRVLSAVRTRGSSRAGTEELLDLASPESIAACAARLLARDEKLAVLVNNAAVYRVSRPEVWAVNVRGPLLLTLALSPLLAPGARVVMVTSGLGALSAQPPALARRLSGKLSVDDIEQLAEEMPGGYGASKAVLNALTRVLAGNWADRDVRVNAVSPGWAQTDMGGPGAPRTLAQGAGSVLLACQPAPPGVTGRVTEDGHELPW